MKTISISRNILFKHFQILGPSKLNIINCLNCSSSTTTSTYCYDKDPGLKFTDEKIQNLLKSITRIRLDKIFRRRHVADNSIVTKFMTTEQLDEECRKSIIKAKELLQMPPVVMIKEDQQKIISKDPGLSNFSDTKYVITDITFGLRHSERKVVIRQTDGTLEHAPMDIAKRMIQAYVPKQGRKILTPRMFQKENLQRCLDEHKYEFILDRACVQYEPYEKDYHDICSQTYLHVNEHKRFDDLRSTRHFGPMAFFFAWHKNIDDLLCDMIKRDFLRNGVELITIMYSINSIQNDSNILLEKLELTAKPSDVFHEMRKSYIPARDDIHEEIKTAIGKSREDFAADEICLQFIENYTKNHALKKVQLELALQTFKEANDEKRKLYEGLRKSHGVQ